MSRSRRRTPITGMTCADSEKADKQFGHQRTRVAIRCAMARDAEALPDRRGTENPWDYAKDGKKWRGNADAKLMRK